jgi:cytochrome c-type biogenesis protein CcmF
MALLGSFSLLLALALSVYSVVAGVLAIARKHDPTSERLAETARRAGIAIWGAVTVAGIALVVSVFRNDFSIAYILHHSNKDLPAPYKFAALWSGQEGSLLFWAWLLSSYGLVLRLRHKVDVKLVAHASVIVAGVQTFFFALVNFAAHPFALVQGTIPPDGNGLNPLLQYAEMVIHPPMLYLGYVGFTVPFAFALAALIMRYPGEKWIHITRRWTMITWGFLGCGIVLGSHWAYKVLGWGGYWGWDPVENASFLPWLTGTAFLHSVMMQEKRGMLKVWNMWLIFSTFLLAIFGTFLTRSGVVSSVHAFAQSSIGTWFVVFMALTVAVCTFFFVRNHKYLKSEHKLESLVSRESSFMFNNLIFVAMCFTVFWGTMFPILSEWVTGSKVTVGPPFFNKVMIPAAMILLILTAAGPLLAWRRTSVDSMKRNFAWPILGMIFTAVALMVFGVRPWQDQSYFYSLVTLSLSAGIAVTIFNEFYRGARVVSTQTGQNIGHAMYTLTRRNTRRYGGYIVHFAVVMMMIGFAGTAFNQNIERELGQGEKMSLGPYTLVMESFSQDEVPNYASQTAIIQVYKNGKHIDTMYPERRVYAASNQPQTMVANRSTMLEDLYLVYSGSNQDNNHPIIKAHINPLVWWLWAGAHVLLIGTIIALIPSSTGVKVIRSERATEEAAVPRRRQTETESVGAGD